ncbi:MAG: 1-acyl-sn-glycerol-3-phosphate acyltransferase [Ruminococcus sp.]|nr:1-acyl-sn-glycerol-3-phosphate acyltransferase [Ruminococcus sp.]
MFDPKTNKYPYPLETDRHYLPVRKDRGIVFDENYPYIDTSLGFRFVDLWVRFLLYTVVFPATYIRLGLKIEGRENLKKHRETLDRGVISVSNHVHLWDYLAIRCAIKPKNSHVLVWQPNINGENGPLIRHVGGIPIPETGRRATEAYIGTIHQLLDDGGWLQVYAEGSMWEYYAPIRPFKRGAAFIACDTGKPVLPMAFSYREPSWIRRNIFRQLACFTLRIGEPLYADETLAKRARQIDLTKRCHAAVCDLAGIKPEENLYEPVFCDFARIDYYTTEYGAGYKGSH